MGRQRQRRGQKGWGKKRNRDNNKDNNKDNNGGYQRFGNDERFPSWQTNRRMEAYYSYQGLHNTCWDDEKKCYRDCATDDEKTKESLRWMETIKKILPASFRIGLNTDSVVRDRLEKEIDDMVGKEMELKIKKDGEEEETTIKIAPSKKIPFIPNGYQLAVDRHTIRRNPKLKALFEWLRIQTEAGFVSRQETVSMIPPVVLDVEPHHQVLDMCAAPGSKTGQIFEIISKIKEGEKEPVGCVIANDADRKRAYLLVHQLKRIHSPANLVTSCDAQFFPMLWKKEQEGMFDRVLADVPCSGDGTMRKNAMVWKNWSSLNSYGLHSLQLALAVHGARLTKVGGYLCYSTCAMNPIENEAVVAELIRSTDGALELVDNLERKDLKDMRARPGWSSWKVLREGKSRREVKDKQKKNNEKMQERRRQFDEHKERTWEKKEDEKTTKEEENSSDKKADSKNTASEDKNKSENSSSKDDTQKTNNKDEKEKVVIEPLGPPSDWTTATLKGRCDKEGYIEYESFDKVEEKHKSTCRQSCFPPTPKEATAMKLDRCLRFLPHDMDTSGFFVALLKKVKPLSAKARERTAKLVQQIRNDQINDNEEKEEEKADPPNKKVKLDNDINNKDESNDKDTEKKKCINYKSKGITAGGNEKFVSASESTIDPLIEYYGLQNFPKDQLMCRAKPEGKTIYFVGKAVKRYMDGGLQDRIMTINTGLKAFERNNNECAVGYRVNQEGIHYLVPYMTESCAPLMVVDVDDFVNCIGVGAFELGEGFSSDFAERVRKLPVGSFVVILRGYETAYAQKMMMVMWRCRGDNVNCLVSKVEKLGMKSKLRALFPDRKFDFVNDDEEKFKKKMEDRKKEKKAAEALEAKSDVVMEGAADDKKKNNEDKKAAEAKSDVVMEGAANDQEKK